MSKTCPLSTAVEFNACACALLDVFHMVVGKRTRSVIATTISRVPLANPGHGHLLQVYPRGDSACLIVPSLAQRNTVFWPISQFLVFPGHRLISIGLHPLRLIAADDLVLSFLAPSAPTPKPKLPASPGGHDPAGRHETLAASYQALRDHYQLAVRSLPSRLP